jgi:predicted metal-dependent hydrolase
MSQKTFDVPGVGKVLVVKRRGTKNLRLSFTAAGQIRVSQPVWLPYASSLQFIDSKQAWINEHFASRQPRLLKDGDRIGKSFRLRYQLSPGQATKTRVGRQTVIVSTALAADHPEVQEAVKKACEKALRIDAQKLLDIRLKQLAKQHGYSYKILKIKKLTSRWGSCSKDGQITLSIYLIQLPWELIDYVILHELAHTKHLNHSRDFWNQLKQTVSAALHLRKQIKQYQPAIIPLR